MRKAAEPVTPSSPPPSDDVLESIHALMHQMRALQYRGLRDGPHAITHLEGKTLGYFGQHPGATQSDLARDSGRDKAQLARLIKGLRDRGLLAAEVDAQDRRNVRLSLSDQGRAVQRLLARQGRRLASGAVAGFSDVERRQLLDLLDRVRRNLDAAA